MLNTFLAILAVLTVMVAHALIKLVFLPFRAIRGLFRHTAAPAR